MKVKVYNYVRHTWLIVANNLLMLGLLSFRLKLFDLQAFNNQAHIIDLSGIIIYFCGTYYLYAPGEGGEPEAEAAAEVAVEATMGADKPTQAYRRYHYTHKRHLGRRTKSSRAN